jgi:uncharacterized protein YceK
MTRLLILCLVIALSGCTAVMSCQPPPSYGLLTIDLAYWYRQDNCPPKHGTTQTHLNAKP